MNERLCRLPLSFWIDRGGTFTDCIFHNAQTNETKTHKQLSSDAAPIECIRTLLNLRDGQPVPPCNIRMGTTVATNALLERRGRKFALLTNHGFEDLWRIGHQARPELFELDIKTPEVLYEEVLTVEGRCDASGKLLAPFSYEDIFSKLKALRARGIENLAVVLIHAHRFPEPERKLAQWAQEAGFTNVSLSHEVDCHIGLLERGNTCSVDAYLTPLLHDYLRGLEQQLPGSQLSVMQSSGGLCESPYFRGHNAVLSGPAGGVVALSHLAKNLKLGDKLVGFDMGGTSTDVSRFDQEIERTYHTELAGVRIRAPMIAIHTVAAGGGSICRFEDQRLLVGPQSAGSSPGPICYGDPQAKQVTVTDVNLFLGRISDERFPFPLKRSPVEHALQRIGDQLQKSPTEIASGFLQVANHHMAEAIRQITITRGHDVRDYSLVVFGGAGGQHACAIANALQIRQIISHPFAGVLSAYGIGLADASWHGHSPRLEDYDQLIEQGYAALKDQGYTSESIEIIRRVDLRYKGTETDLCLPYYTEPAKQRKVFETAHLQQFGYARPEHTMETAGYRIEMIGRSPKPEAFLHANANPAKPIRFTSMWSGNKSYDQVPVYRREELAPGQLIEGPALVLENIATFVVDNGWKLEMATDGVLRLTAGRDQSFGTQVGPERDETNLEIFNHSFMSIAEQMGSVLQRTAISTNIRERMDFSCAVFDRLGQLVANAPHIPVHLGAMGESVRAVIHQHPDLKPGDVFATNDPDRGGSHLPDITVVSPIHDPHGELLFFTANRGHHADVGGSTPGSMPPFSQRREEEGIVFSGIKIVSEETFQEEEVINILKSGAFPARVPATNLADLKAQIAANHTGAMLLKQLVERYGYDTVAAYMQHIQDNAAQCVGEAIERLSDGLFEYQDHLDDGTPLCVRIEVTGRRMKIDFEGTGKMSSGNLNAPRAVSVAAVIYVLRCLVGKPIPLNHGCLRDVKIVFPKASLLDPNPDAAVAGGNVETSQRIVDILLGALNISAASQGTMNNLTFGDESSAYYETIGGGAGASASYEGASGVQTHMTNTRITDAEVLEERYPVILRDFSIRRDSGGTGKNRGGNGLVRDLEFLEEMNLSILSERRATRAFGLEGANAGQAGKNTYNGRAVEAKAQLLMKPGDRFRVETPGGGGFGTENS